MVDVEAGRLVGVEGLVAQLLRHGGVAFEQLVLLGREREVESWRDPNRRPLKHGQVRGLSRYRGHVLNRAGARADGRHPLPGRRLAVIPTGRMELAAAKPPRPGDVRDVGHVKHPDGADHHVEFVFAAVAVGQRPAVPGVRPAHGDNRGVGPQARAQPVVDGDLFQIRQDLGLVRVRLAPPRVGRKGI
jgi:hypothetical protein